jgi:putative endonuclease
VPDPRHWLGRAGEDAVAAWLAAAGWTPLERRWRCPSGELDLVLRDPSGALVGVEVKLRRTSRAGSGAESVDRRRLRRLRATLAAYASVAAPSLRFAELRIDLVTVTPASDGRWRLRRLPAIDAW